jgi:NAD(P)H-dependent FMN reductase
MVALKGEDEVTVTRNRSIPGALKNAIDHASWPQGQKAWKGKLAGNQADAARDRHAGLGRVEPG